MKVRMSLAVSPVPYLTAGKEYELYGQGGCTFIYDDFKKKTYICIAKCAHISDAHWELVPEQASAHEGESFCTFADLKAGEHFVLDGAIVQAGSFSTVFFKIALAGEAVVVLSKNSPCIVGMRASFWPDCPVRKITVCFGV